MVFSRFRLIGVRIVRSEEIFSLTSKAHEEAEEHGVEEAKADRKNVLMDHCRHSENKEHGSRSETFLGYLE